MLLIVKFKPTISTMTILFIYCYMSTWNYGWTGSKNINIKIIITILYSLCCVITYNFIYNSYNEREKFVKMKKIAKILVLSSPIIYILGLKIWDYWFGGNFIFKMTRDFV